MSYDFVIVGSGLFGATIAQQATARGKKCLVVDKNNHIAGNCYTKKWNNVDVHVYGPHIFHTSNERVWNYVNQFAKFNNFVNRPKVNFEGSIYSFPINLMTLYQIWGISDPQNALKALDDAKCNIPNPTNLEDWVLSKVGREIYEKFIYGYTKKQWMRDPKILPASIIKRVPIRLTYDDNYYNDTYQGIPVDGYTSMFEKMLSGVEVKLNTDFFADRKSFETLGDRIVYSGRLDELFDLRFGELEYRTLDFIHEEHDVPDYQGNAVINYTSEHVPWTRTIEHKHFTCVDSERTIITREFPIAWHKGAVPYYPVNSIQESEVLRAYQEEVKNLKNYVVGGRLGRHTYLDMHQVIGQALKICDEIL